MKLACNNPGCPTEKYGMTIMDRVVDRADVTIYRCYDCKAEVVIVK